MLLKETLIKSNSPRSNTGTHAAEFDTLRFNQRVLNSMKFFLSAAYNNSVLSGN